jgi:hypothetical protein
MNSRRKQVFGAVLLLAGLLTVSLMMGRQAGAQGKTEELTVGRYKIVDLPLGKFVYRMMFDTWTADYWLWVNGEWERPEVPKGGRPWKDLKPVAGRFQLLSQVPADLDRELYVLDSVTGRMWARSARNRSEVLNTDEWREVPLPKPRR